MVGVVARRFEAVDRVQVVAEHQQEGLGGELLLRGEHGVAEAELLGLHDELHLGARLVDLLGVPEWTDGASENCAQNCAVIAP